CCWEPELPARRHLALEPPPRARPALPPRRAGAGRGAAHTRVRAMSAGGAEGEGGRAVARVKLSGKVAIVTGTSPNIGGGIAEGLAEEGATVVCVDVASENAAQCADAIARRGGQA